MLSVLVEGTLVAGPKQRTSAKGQPFTTATLRTTCDDGESILCSVIAFSASAAEALAQLSAGDTVAVAGPASINRWEKDDEAHVGLKIVASRVMSVYEAGMRRKAASARHEQGQDREPRDSRPPAAPQRNRHPAPAQAPARGGTFDDMTDDLPI